LLTACLAPRSTYLPPFAVLLPAAARFAYSPPTSRTGFNGTGQRLWQAWPVLPPSLARLACRPACHGQRQSMPPPLVARVLHLLRLPSPEHGCLLLALPHHLACARVAGQLLSPLPTITYLPSCHMPAWFLNSNPSLPLLPTWPFKCLSWVCLFCVPGPRAGFCITPPAVTRLDHSPSPPTTCLPCHFYKHAFFSYAACLLPAHHLLLHYHLQSPPPPFPWSLPAPPAAADSLLAATYWDTIA